MVRTPSRDKSGVRKGTWTPEEDKKLIAYVTRYGSWNWRQLPRFAGLARCGKSCRLRWMNYLRPNLKRGNFTQEEEQCIIKLHAKLGNRWSAIAAQLPGRTDNEIKNHWHTTLKKRFQQNPATNDEQPKSSKSTEKESRPQKDSVPNNGYSSVQVTTPAATNSQISDSTTAPLSPLSSSSELSSITSSDHTPENFVIEDDDFAFLDGSFWTEPYLADILHAPNDELVPSDGNIYGASQSAQDTTTTEIFDACAISLPNDQSSNASLVDLESEFGSLFEPHTEPMVESFWTQPYVADVSHLPSDLLTPFVAPPEYFSPLCGTDLWSTQSTLYDEQLSLF